MPASKLSPYKCTGQQIFVEQTLHNICISFDVCSHCRLRYRRSIILSIWNVTQLGQYKETMFPFQFITVLFKPIATMNFANKLSQMYGAAGKSLLARKVLSICKNLPPCKRGTSCPAPLIVTNVNPSYPSARPPTCRTTCAYMRTSKLSTTLVLKKKEVPWKPL